MSHLNVVAIAGSISSTSRTLVLAEAIVAELASRLPIQASVLSLAGIARELGGSLHRKELSPVAEDTLQAIEHADLLVVAAPVYRASYPGLLKHLFDLVGQEALIDTPVLLAATGGSERHALVIDHQLRPLFSFFQAVTLPIGVYASEVDFQGHALHGVAIHTRIALAADRAAGLLAEHRIALRAIA